MNEMHEAVALPDPAVQRLVHPTDLAEARELYRRGWWFGRLSSIPVAVAVGTVIWASGAHLVAAIAATVSTFVIGLLARGWFTSRAWDFIPRSRQRTDGAPVWHLLSTIIDAAALLVTATALIVAIHAQPITQGVVAFAAGAGLAIAAIQAGEVLAASTRGDKSLSIIRQLILLIAVGASTAGLAIIGYDGQWGSQAFLAAGIGATTLFGAQATRWIATTLHERRSHTEDQP